MSSEAWAERREQKDEYLKLLKMDEIKWRQRSCVVV